MKTLQYLIAASLVFCALHTTALAKDDGIADLGTRKAGHDWPTFLGPNGDGKSAETGIIKPWPEAGLAIHWQRKVGEGYSAPSISRGRLLLFERKGDREQLVCLNSETGKEIWTFGYATAYDDIYGYGDGPRTTPVIDGNRVYIHGVEGPLYCLNLADGTVIWKLNTNEMFDVVTNFFGVGSTPIIEKDLLIVPVGGSEPSKHPNILAANGQVTPNGSGIVAFNKHSGEVVYQLGNEVASYASPQVVTINDKRIGLYFARGGLLGFDPQAGKELFHFPWRAKKLESVNAASAVVAGDLVYIGEAYGPGSAVLRIKETGYDVVWQDSLRSRNKAMLLHWTTAIHHDGYLYAGHGRNAGTSGYRCIDMATGEIQWTHKLKELSSLTYVDGHFIGVGERGTLTLLKANPKEAQVVSTTKLVDEAGKDLLVYPTYPAPVVSHGFLYLRGKDRLVCIDLMQ